MTENNKLKLDIPSKKKLTVKIHSLSYFSFSVSRCGVLDSRCGVRGVILGSVSMASPSAIFTAEHDDRMFRASLQFFHSVTKCVMSSTFCCHAFFLYNSFLHNSILLLKSTIIENEHPGTHSRL